MFDTDAALWVRLSPILDGALDLPPERREAYLAQACAGDPHLHATATLVLTAAERPSALLDQPVTIAPALLQGSPPEAVSTGSAAWIREPATERFLPGMIVGGRYRIVSLIGRGGMGEVYRADDLRLGSPVALKFLPTGLERDSPHLQLLVRELRTARQIAHPNVCRVWDVGDHEGAAFLTMEFVDGESLAVLLKRAGRLPPDKALDVAQQLCAGLAPTPGENILHRDLKPGNVMIDGRGRVHIVDFGIARLTEEIHGPEVLLGTPGYMSPEQFGGRELTIRSDIYVLGLLLYELFTGQRAFQATTIAGLRRLQDETSPISPTRLVEGLDPSIERVILACLSRNPEERPASAREVAAALPGHDPLEAVLAAGETPSPDLVAASGSSGILSLRMVLVLGAVWCLLLALVLATSGEATALGHLPFPKRVEPVQARETLASLGYPGPPVDFVHGYWARHPYIDWLRARDVASGRWKPLEAPGSLELAFFYRESTRYLVPKHEGGALRSGKPDLRDPPLEAGDALLWTDLRGRLRSLEVIPPPADFSRDESFDPDWKPLFAAAGFDVAEFVPISPTRVPMVGFDRRAAWSGTLHDAGDIPVHLEAAAWRGRPVYFECVFPFDPLWSEVGAERTRIVDVQSTPLWNIWIVVVMALGAFLTLRNLRLGRADRRGAFHLAALVFSARLLYWVLACHHVPVIIPELELFAIALGRSLTAATVVWSLFTALEPAIRRLWPRGLPGWNRLLAGRFRDTLVGRDLFVGAFVGLSLVVSMDRIHILLPEWLGMDSLAEPVLFVNTFYAPVPQLLLGGRFVVAGVLAALLSAVYTTLAVWVLILALRIVLRKNSLTAFAFVIYWTVSAAPTVESGYAWTGLVSAFATGVIITAALQRFGLLAAFSGGLSYYVFSSFPITLDVSAPYFGAGLTGILAVAGLATYGAITSLGRRRLPIHASP